MKITTFKKNTNRSHYGMGKVILSALLAVSFTTTISGQPLAPMAVGPVPSENQLRWQKMEYYAFIHFSTNTFTNQEWGYGAPEDAKLFNPTNPDCEQWARVCKESGMTGIILTAKHHSGFCLWPTETTAYSVKNSPWKNGKGDIVGDLAKACRKYGLKLGIYISPWDRNSPSYGLLDADGSAPYVKNIFRKQIEECLTKYGDIFEIWFDGANGGDGYYGGVNANRMIDRKTYYDWKNTYSMIRKLQPKIVIWNDNGDRADLRWVGTESGYVGETNWSLLNATGDVPEDMLRYGVENGNAWVPGEVNTSIRPGWFYHESEDKRVKNLPKLLDTYYKSIGRNGTFLLNFPIDKRGLIHENDHKEAVGLANAVKEAFAVNLAEKAKVSATNSRGKDKKFAPENVLDGNTESYWSTDDQTKSASLTLDFGKPTSFNRFTAEEYIRLGQRVKAFKIEAMVDGQWKELKDQLVSPDRPGTTTIGYRRIITFPTVKATQLRFTITDAKASPLISGIGVYHAPQILVPPTIIRDKSGTVHITAGDKESELYYSIDGSKPTTSSKKYAGPVDTDGNKVMVRAIAYDVVNKKSSDVTEELYDLARKDWKIVSPGNAKSVIIDGDVNTSWYRDKGTSSPDDLVIDLGKMQSLTGFRYFPGDRSGGVITHYEFYVSKDLDKWKMVSSGEFSNIINNPFWQIKNFDLTEGRYIKLRALQTSGGNTGYAELDIVTK